MRFCLDGTAVAPRDCRFALIHLRGIIPHDFSFPEDIVQKSPERFDRAGSHLEAVNLLDFSENDDPSHPTKLCLHSRKVASEARGIPCLVEYAMGAPS